MLLSDATIIQRLNSKLEALSAKQQANSLLGLIPDGKVTEFINTESGKYVSENKKFEFDKFKIYTVLTRLGSFVVGINNSDILWLDNH